MSASANPDSPTHEPCCAVIVNYRTPGLTIRCASALVDQRGNSELSLLIIDNGSRDGSDAKLAAWAAKQTGVEIEALGDNLGFGGACNFGFDTVLERSPGVRWVLLLNPDTVPGEGMLEALCASAAAHPEAGIVGGRILSGDGQSVWYENGRYRQWTLGKSHAPAPAGQDDFETEFVTGALMLVDAAMLREGLRFDEHYFLYVEDLDLCREVRDRGRTLRVTLRATARHDEGASQAGENADRAGMRERQLYYITRNKMLFAKKRLRPLPRLVTCATAVLVKPLAGVVRYRSLRFLSTYYSALLAGMQGRRGPI